MSKKTDKPLSELASFIVGRLTQEEKKKLKLLISKAEAEEKLMLPVSLFENKLSALELTVRYLKDNKKLSFKKISKILGRKYTTLTSTYYRSLLKFKGELKYKFSEYDIPIDVLKKDKLSILEAIVKYLSERELSTKEIARILGRGYETVKTVKRRLKSKS